MNGRKRNILLGFRVTELEDNLIKEKMKQAHTKNFAAYMRKMAIDGYIINVDYSHIKENTAQLQKIGANINQILKRMNITGNLYEQDIDEIKGALHEIWQLQRLNLSKVR